MLKFKSNILYLYSPVLFFILILRASIDPILDYTKIAGIGLGALLNLIIVALYLYAFIKERLVLPKTLLSVWGGFIFIGFISIFFSPDKINSLRSFFSVLTYFSIFSISFYFVKDKVGLISVIKIIIYSSIMPLMYSLYELVNIYGSELRLFGTFSHPNIFAFYLVLIISLCFYVIKTEFVYFSLRFLNLCKYILFLSVIFLILTKTRSAWLSIIMVFLFYGLLNERKYILYIFFSIVVSLLIPEVQERILDIFVGGTENNLAAGESLNSYAWRKVVWFSSFDSILDNPFLGHGYDTFSYYFLNFFPLEEDKGFDAHNTYVQIAFDMGFLGLFSYLSLFFLLLKRLCSYYFLDRKGGSIFIALVFSYLVVGYSDNMLFYLSYNWYFWLLLGSVYYFTGNYNLSFRGLIND